MSVALAPQAGTAGSGSSGDPELSSTFFAENPYWTVRRAAQRLDMAYTTAERAIETLQSLGFLARTTSAKRDRVYCARAIMKILDEPANLLPPAIS